MNIAGIKNSVLSTMRLLLFCLQAMVWTVVSSGTVAAQSVKSRVDVVYEEYPRAFRNPMKGLREFFLKGEDRIRDDYPYPFGSLIKEYMPWNMLEDTISDGVDKIKAYSDYRWKGVEKDNIKVIPRVFLVWLEPWHGGKAKNPNNIDDLNGWHWPKDIVGQTAPYKQIPNSWGAYVEIQDSIVPIEGGYFDASFPERVKLLVDKIGQAWDNDPRVAYVEMGIIGEWGEHHDPNISTYWPPHDEPKHVDNRTWVPGIEKVLGVAFSKAFQQKKVMVRYAYDFKDYTFGIYWDSWSQKEEQVRGYEEMKKMGDRWKTQPIGGEITWNWGSLGKFKSFEQVVADKEYMDITIEQIRNLHCNHLGGITWADFEDSNFKRNADSLQRALGYRFFIEKASYKPVISKGKLSLDFTVRNLGSSPFYYDWPLQVVLLDPVTRMVVWKKTLSDVNISHWMPGDDWNVALQKYETAAPAIQVKKDLRVDTALPKGEYLLALTILDPAGQLPSLRFANTNYMQGGYTLLGYIGMDTLPKRYEVEKTKIDDIQQDRSLYYLIP